MVMRQSSGTDQTRKCERCGKDFVIPAARSRSEQRFCSHRCGVQKQSYARGRTSKTLRAEDAAYIAGLLDGEGCFGIFKRTARKPLVSDQYSIHIAICITDPYIIPWLAEVTGCGWTASHDGSNIKHKAVYTWHCASTAAATLAEQILPYLRIKREQAKLLIDTHRRVQEPGDWRAVFDAAYQKSRGLNRRGRTPSLWDL